MSFIQIGNTLDEIKANISVSKFFQLANFIPRVDWFLVYLSGSLARTFSLSRAPERLRLKFCAVSMLGMLSLFLKASRKITHETNRPVYFCDVHRCASILWLKVVVAAVLVLLFVVAHNKTWFSEGIKSSRRDIQRPAFLQLTQIGFHWLR